MAGGIIDARATRRYFDAKTKDVPLFDLADMRTVRVQVYVGQDDSVDVHGNFATDCIIGFEIENSRHVVLRDENHRNQQN